MDDITSAPAQESTSAPVEGLSNEQQQEKTPEKYRVKVYDQEQELTLEELKKDYELRQASHVRMQKAAESEKQYNKLLKDFESDPWKAFEQLKLDPDLMAEQRLLKKLEREMMSPEEKRIFEKEQSLTAREQQLKDYEDAKKEHDENLAKQQQEALTYKAIQEIDSDIGDVLRATGLKPTPRVVSRIAEIMLAHLDSEDGERLGAEKAFGIVRSEMSEEMSEYLAALPPEQLVQTLPKSVLDAIRKYDLDKVRGTNPLKKAQSSNRTSTAPSAKDSRRMSTDDLFANLEKKLK